MSRCCLDLAKFLLFIINFAAWLVCGALLATSFYVFVNAQGLLGFPIRPDLSPENETALYFIFFLMLWIVLGFCFIFTFLGCCGAACQNRCMLGSFIIILFVFLGANVGAIAYMYVEFPSELAMMSAELKKTIPYYDVVDLNSIVRTFWDLVQPGLECCGAESFRDWTQATGLRPGRKVPGSCCRPGEESDCVYQPEGSTAYLDGCIERMATPLQAAFWAVPTALALVLLLALCVCTRGDRSNRRERSAAGPRRRNKRADSQLSQYSEETGYIYRGGQEALAAYPSAPPYHGDVDPRRVDSYPTGVIPPSGHDYHQPLIQPPSYHDVMARRNNHY